MWDPSDNKRKFINNRYFMAFRGGEMQNNWWDYHPYDDILGTFFLQIKIFFKYSTAFVYGMQGL